MITRRWFNERPGGDVSPWVRAVDAPDGARPLRTTVSVTLAEEAGDAPWAEIGTAWFADVAHLARFDQWSGSPPTGLTLAADAQVRRGGDWLDQRWATGGPRFVHVALARRHPSLDREAFSSSWRDHAGSVGATPIPDAARGCAYVQSHPLPSTDEPPYDAMTEVWFDDLDALRIRIDWMAEALATAPPDDLFGERHLFGTREEIVSR